MDFIRSFFLGTEKISLTSFPSDCQLLSAKWGTPLSQQLTNSLLHWPVQPATYLQRESLKQLCHHLAGQSYSEFEWLAIRYFFFFSFCLSLISPWFINNCSAVKKQFINCSQRKVKLSKEPLSFAAYLFFPLEPVLADEMRQAGGQAGGQAAPLPCPPLPAGWWLARRQGSCADICQPRTWTRPPQPMAALSVSTASGCVLSSQKPARDIFV